MMVPDVLKVDMNTAAWKVLLAAGTHFRCRACFFTLPIKYRSPDDKYCIDCYQVINEDRNAVIDGPAALIPQTCDIEGKPVTIIMPVNNNIKPYIHRGRGRPRKEISVNVIESNKSCRLLAKELKVSAMTILRRRRASQGVLL